MLLDDAFVQPVWLRICQFCIAFIAIFVLIFFKSRSFQPYDFVIIFQSAVHHVTATY